MGGLFLGFFFFFFSLPSGGSVVKGTPCQCSILAWETPWTGKPGRLESMRLQKRHDLSTKKQYCAP